MNERGESVSIDRVELEALRKGSRMFDDAIGFLALQHGCPLTVTKEAPREECYDCTEESDNIHEDCWRAFFERREAETREMEPKEWCKQHVNDLQLTHAQVMGFQATVGAAAMENLDRAVKAEAACIAKDIAIRQALTWDTPRSEMRAYLEPALTPDIGDEFRKRYDEAVAAVAGIRVKAKEHLCDQCLGSEIKPCEVGRDWNEPICGQACNMREFFDWLESTSSLGADILQRIEDMRDLLEGVDTAADGEELGWELAAVREFLKAHKHISRKDAALAQMRGVLEKLDGDANSDDNYCEATCEYIGREEECEYSEAHCRTKWRNLVIRHGLSSSLGASTLEYIRGLEQSNEKAKGLLRRSREIDCLPKCDDLNINTQMCDMRGEQCQWCALNATIDAYLKGAGE